MNNNNDSKFGVGLLLGLILGGGAVFLLGTRTGKNLLKIVSEQGLDGLINLLEEYDLADLEEYEEVENQDQTDVSSEHHTEGQEKKSSFAKASEGQEEAPKRRFFKKIRR
jgi:hypothetical protein